MPFSLKYLNQRGGIVAKDIISRALKTFWQAAISYLVAAFSTQMSGVDVFDIQGLKSVGSGLLIGTLAAGLSATWNSIVQPKLDKYKRGTG